jgi:KDO2-lipid IV(A) lauroyltransferase
MKFFEFLQLFLVRILLRTLGLFFIFSPRFIRNGFISFLTWISFQVFKFRRYTLIRNLHIAFPEKSYTQIMKVARASIWNTIYNFMEVSSLFTWHQPKPQAIQGWETYLQTNQLGKGILGLTLHMGNGDAGCALLSLNKMPIHLISKKFKWQALNSEWFGVREKMGTQFIDPHNPRNAYSILAALKKNEVVVFVMDQFMGKPYGILTNFFGRPTGTSQGLALFQIKTQSPVVPIYTYRDLDHQIKVVIEKPLDISKVGIDKSRDEQILQLTEMYNAKLEEIIKKHPEQWMWIHRRWKKWE